MRVYFISGLGADRRMFSRLTLPASFTIVHLEWLEPIPDETLADYCKRFATSIDTSEAFAVVGLSFGGIIATELTKLVNPMKTILISSISTCEELPFYFRLAGKLGLNNLIPVSLLKSSNPITEWFFGAKTEEEKELLKQILKDTSPAMLSWAINCILNWNNVIRPDHLYHIHGKADKILPYRCTIADLGIDDGEHIMVFSQADTVNLILQIHLDY